MVMLGGDRGGWARGGLESQRGSLQSQRRGFNFILPSNLKYWMGVKITREYTVVGDKSAPLTSSLTSITLDDTARQHAIDFCVTSNPVRLPLPLRQVPSYPSCKVVRCFIEATLKHC